MARMLADAQPSCCVQQRMNTYRDRSNSQACGAQVASYAQSQPKHQQQSQPLKLAMDVPVASTWRLPGLLRCPEGCRSLAVWHGQYQSRRDTSPRNYGLRRQAKHDAAFPAGRERLVQPPASLPPKAASRFACPESHTGRALRSVLPLPAASPRPQRASVN